ncbi:hypothetical protein D3C75_1298650 [compost metagenome]
MPGIALGGSFSIYRRKEKISGAGVEMSQLGCILERNEAGALMLQPDIRRRAAPQVEAADRQGIERYTAVPFAGIGYLCVRFVK